MKRAIDFIRRSVPRGQRRALSEQSVPAFSTKRRLNPRLAGKASSARSLRLEREKLGPPRVTALPERDGFAEIH